MGMAFGIAVDNNSDLPNYDTRLQLKGRAVFPIESGYTSQFGNQPCPKETARSHAWMHEHY